MTALKEHKHSEPAGTACVAPTSGGQDTGDSSLSTPGFATPVSHATASCASLELAPGARDLLTHCLGMVLTSPSHNSGFLLTTTNILLLTTTKSPAAVQNSRLASWDRKVDSKFNYNPKLTSHWYMQTCIQQLLDSSVTV